MYPGSSNGYSQGDDTGKTETSRLTHKKIVSEYHPFPPRSSGYVPGALELQSDIKIVYNIWHWKITPNVTLPTFLLS